MYVVHVNLGTSTATIHRIGGCGSQRKPSSRSAEGLDEWSYPIKSLRQARDYALMARTQQTMDCETCGQNGEFGA